MEDRYLFKAKRVDNGEWVQGALLLHDADTATIFNQHPADGSLQGFEVDRNTAYEEEHIYDYVDCMDVIGNIFDNPELLGRNDE